MCEGVELCVCVCVCKGVRGGGGGYSREGSRALQQDVQLCNTIPPLRPLLTGAHGHQLSEVLRVGSREGG